MAGAGRSDSRIFSSCGHVVQIGSTYWFFHVGKPVKYFVE